MKKLLLGGVLCAIQACGYTPAEQPTDACMDVLVQSQVRTSARSEQIVEEMITFLASNNPSELRPTDGEAASRLAVPMREIFIANHEVSTNLLGEPIPITAGAGFGTLDATGEAENLFGIYQANSPSAACNYPFAPTLPRTINPDDAGSAEVPFVASKVMKAVCGVLSNCSSMEGSLFLNVSNSALHGTRNKLFFDDARYAPDNVVYRTFEGWHPGDASVPDTDWAKLGLRDYLNGDTDGNYVIYKQSNMKQYILLFYKPFEDNEGNFGGVAYAFVNLYEEYLVNDAFSSAVTDGICVAPPRNCTTGE